MKESWVARMLRYRKAQRLAEKLQKMERNQYRPGRMGGLVIVLVLCAFITGACVMGLVWSYSTDSTSQDAAAGETSWEPNHNYSTPEDLDP